MLAGLLQLALAFLGFDLGVDAADVFHCSLVRGVFLRGGLAAFLSGTLENRSGLFDRAALLFVKLVQIHWVFISMRSSSRMRSCTDLRASPGDATGT
jgi:hypothetical protein